MDYPRYQPLNIARRSVNDAAPHGDGPISGPLLALAFMGFGGSDVQKGVPSRRERCAPRV